MKQPMTAIAVLALLAACDQGNDGRNSGAAATVPEQAQAEGIAESVSDVEAANRAAATPLPAEPARDAP